MSRNQQKISVRNSIIAVFVILTAVILRTALISDERWYWCLLITIPAVVITTYCDSYSKKTIVEKKTFNYDNRSRTILW